MADRAGPKLFSIPPQRGFADALVEGIVAQYGADRMVLARGTILAASNRSVRAINDAFVRHSEKGLLLPRLVTIGDSDLEESIGLVFDGSDAAPIPPAIEPLRRHLILARLIQQASKAAQPLDAGAAMRLAADLARTLDQLVIEGIDPRQLASLPVKEELSEHWQKSLDLLDVVLRQWPLELARLGRIDLVDRRNRLLLATAQKWRTEPPGSFVIAAGISTAAPAVAQLLKVIANSPQGAVVFSGVDLSMAEAEWDAIRGGRDERAEEAHPQYHIAQLLDRMDAARDDVQLWQWGANRSEREAQVNHVMAPARFTRNWSQMKAEDRAFEGVRQAQFAGPADEAQGIAIALREALETPLRTAALITPDRDLAQRVAAHLKRWGIEADDSAGRALSATLPGSLILALCMAAAEGFAPVALLGLLKHPLVQKGEQRRHWLDGARWLDLALRGPRPAPGLDGVSVFLAGGGKRQRGVRDRAAAWWRDARGLLEPLAASFATKSLPIPTLFAALREAATALCGDEAWRGQDGRALADLIDRIEDFAVAGPDRLSPVNAPDLVRDLMEAVAIRPAWGGHHRIFIWGLLEARLQTADLMILGGLNEGSWPQLPSPDPWLAPRIRTELKLPGLERRIGLSAHDFASALGGKDVLITRAVRDAAAPTMESRFLLRLNAFSGGLEVNRLPDFARMIDGNDGASNPADRPAPRPPAEERPKEIRVTEVDRLKADPFAWYARAMMGLFAIDMIDAEPSAAWRGTLIHDVLEKWANEDGFAEGQLIARVEAELSKPEAHKLLKALWLPQLRQACGWIESQIIALDGDGRKPRLAEAYGRTEIAGVTLIGQADRIDAMPENRLAIVDYKTGSPPSVKQASQGYALQLGLIGLLAARGGFKDLSGTPDTFEYWKLNRDQKTREFGGVAKASIGKEATETIIDHAERNLIGVIETWINGEEPFIPRLHPEWAKYGDYDQLSRLEEWYGR